MQSPSIFPRNKNFFVRAKLSLGALFLMSVGYWLLLAPGLEASVPTPYLKTKKYLTLLLKKPQPGYLFDTFYQGWLERSSTAELVTFLTEKADQDPGYQVLAALVYIQGGEQKEALLLLGQALKQRPTWTPVLLMRAELSMGAFNIESALADLHQALEHCTQADQREDIRLLLGRAYLKNGQRKECLATLSALVEEAEDVETTFPILDMMSEEGLYNEALTLVRARQQKTQDPYQALQLSLKEGALLERLEKNDEALSLYGELIPRIASGSWLERTVLEKIKGIFRSKDDALGYATHLEKLALAHSTRVDIQQEAARALIEIGSTEKGLALYKECLSANPGNRALQETYVDALLEAGQLETALYQLQLLKKIIVNDPEIILREARLYHRLSQREPALASLEEYRNLLEASDSSDMRVSRMLVSMGYTDEAQKLLEESLKRYPASVSLRHSLAERFYTKGLKERGAEILVDGARISPLNLEEVLSIVRALKEKDDHLSAQKVFSLSEESFGASYRWLKEKVQLLKALEEKKDPTNAENACLDVAQKAFAVAADFAEYKESAQWLLSALAAPDSGNHPSYINNPGSANTSDSNNPPILAHLDALSEAGSPRNYFLRAAYCYSIGDRGSALKENRAGCTRFANDIPLAMQSISFLKEERAWSEAIAETTRLMELNPGKKAQYISELVDLERKNGQVDKAYYWIEEWKKHLPGALAPIYKQAELLREQEKNEDLVSLYRKTLIKYPDNREVLDRLAEGCLLINLPQDAAHCYWRSIELCENLRDKLGYMNKLIELHSTNQTDHLFLHNLQARTLKNPDSLFHLLSLARLYKKQEDYPHYLECLSKALLKEPHNVELLQDIARAHEEQGELDKAADYYSKARSFDTGSRSTSELIRLYLQQGEEEKANELLYELAGGANMDADDHLKLIQQFISSSQFEMAQQHLNECIHSYTTRPEFKYLKGTIFFQEGSFKEAMECFLSILEQKDLAYPTPASPSLAFLQSYSRKNSFMIPEPILFLQKISIYRQRTVQQNQNSSIYRSSSRSSSRGSSQSLPSTEEEYRISSIAYLSSLQVYLNEEEQDHLMEKLRGPEVPYPELLFKGNLGGGLALSAEELADLKMRYPNDPVILYIALHSSLSRNGDPSESLPLFKELFPHYPIAASMGILQLSQKIPLDDEYFLKAVDAVFKESPDTRLQAMTFLMNRNRSTIEMSDTLTKTIREKIENYFQNYEEEVKRFPYLKLQYLGYIFKEGQYSDGLRYADELLTQSSTPTPSKGKVGMLMSSTPYYGRQAFGIYSQGINIQQALGKINSLASQMMQILQQYPDLNKSLEESPQTHLQQTSLQQSGVQQENLLQIPKNPLLRFMLAYSREGKEHKEKALENYLASEDSSPDALLLAAAFYKEIGAPEKALGCLNDLLSKPINFEERKQVDGYIIALATEFVSLKKAGQESARRMCAHKLPYNEKQQLLEVLRQFDLTDEAEALEQSLAAYPVMIGNNPNLSTRRQNQDQRIADLLEKGEVDQAIKDMVKEVKKAAKDASVQRQYPQSYSSSSLSYIPRKLEERGLTQTFIEALRPSGNSTFTQTFEFAYAQELLGKRDDAINSYQAALALNPQHELSAVHLTLLLAEKDIEAAQEVLNTALSRGRRTLLITRFAEEIQRAMNSRNENSLNAISLFVSILSPEALRKIPKDPLVAVMQRLANSSYQNSENIPSIGDQAYEQQKQVLSEKNRNWCIQREQILKNLLVQLIDIPLLSSEAFKYLRMVHRLKQISDQDYYSLAIKSLLAQTRNAMFGQQAINSNLSESPLMVLAEYQKRCYNNLEESEKKSLHRSYMKTYLQKVENIEKLLLCPETDFVSTARPLLSPLPTNFSPQYLPLSEVISVWIHTGANTSLDELLTEHISSQLEKSNSYDQNAVRQYLNHLIKDDSRGSALIFAKKFIQLQLEHIEKKEKESSNFVASNSLMDMALQTLTPLLQSKTAIWHLAECVKPLLAKATGQLPSLRNYYANLSFGLEDIASSPFAGPWTNWKNYDLPYMPNSITKKFFTDITHRGKEQVSKVLKNKNEPTFGISLISVWAESQSPETLLNWLGGYMQEFAQGTKQQHLEFVDNLHLLEPNLLNPNGALSEGGQQFLDMMKDVSQRSAQKKYEEILAITTFEPIILPEVVSTLQALLPDYPEKADSVYDHIVKISRAYFNRMVSSYNNLRETDTSFRLLQQLSQNPQLSIKLFALDKCRTLNVFPRDIDYSLERIVGQTLNNWGNEAYNRISSETGTSSQKKLRAAKEAYSRMEKEVGSREFPLADLSSFISFLRGSEQEFSEWMVESKLKTPFAQDMKFLVHSSFKATHELSKEDLEILESSLTSNDHSTLYRLQKHLSMLPYLKNVKNLGTYVTELMTMIHKEPLSIRQKIYQQGEIDMIWEMLPTVPDGLQNELLEQTYSNLSQLRSPDRLKNYARYALPLYLKNHNWELVRKLMPYVQGNLALFPHSYILFNSEEMRWWIRENIRNTAINLDISKMEALYKKSAPEIPFLTGVDPSADMSTCLEFILTSDLDDDIKMFSRVFFDAFDAQLSPETLKAYAEHNFSEPRVKDSVFALVYRCAPDSIELSVWGELMKEDDFFALINDRTGKQQGKLDAYVRYVVGGLSKGDEAPLTLFLEKISKVYPSTSSSTRRSVISVIIPPLAEWLYSKDRDARIDPTKVAESLVQIIFQCASAKKEGDQYFIDSVKILFDKLKDAPALWPVVFSTTVELSKDYYAHNEQKRGEVLLLDATFPLLEKLANGASSELLNFLYQEYLSYPKALPELPSSFQYMHQKFLTNSYDKKVSDYGRTKEGSIKAAVEAMQELDASISKGTFINYRMSSFFNKFNSYQKEVIAELVPVMQERPILQEFHFMLYVNNFYSQKDFILEAQQASFINSFFASEAISNTEKHSHFNDFLDKILRAKNNIVFFKPFLEYLLSIDPSLSISDFLFSNFSYCYSVSLDSWPEEDRKSYARRVLKYFDSAPNDFIKSAFSNSHMAQRWKYLPLFSDEEIPSLLSFSIENASYNTDNSAIRIYLSHVLPVLIRLEAWNDALKLLKTYSSYVNSDISILAYCFQPAFDEWAMQVLPEVARNFNRAGLESLVKLEASHLVALSLPLPLSVQERRHKVIDNSALSEELRHFAHLLYDAFDAQLQDRYCETVNTFAFSDKNIQANCFDILLKYAPKKMNREVLHGMMKALDMGKLVNDGSAASLSQLKSYGEYLVLCLEGGSTEPLIALGTKVREATLNSDSSVRVKNLLTLINPLISWINQHPANEKVSKVVQCILDVTRELGGEQRKANGNYLEIIAQIIKALSLEARIHFETIFDTAVVASKPYYSENRQTKNSVKLQDGTYDLIDKLAKTDDTDLHARLVNKYYDYANDLPPLPYKLREVLSNYLISSFERYLEDEGGNKSAKAAAKALCEAASRCPRIPLREMNLWKFFYKIGHLNNDVVKEFLDIAPDTATARELSVRLVISRSHVEAQYEEIGLSYMLTDLKDESIALDRRVNCYSNVLYSINNKKVFLPYIQRLFRLLIEGVSENSPIVNAPSIAYYCLDSIKTLERTIKNDLLRLFVTSLTEQPDKWQGFLTINPYMQPFLANFRESLTPYREMLYNICAPAVAKLKNAQASRELLRLLLPEYIQHSAHEKIRTLISLFPDIIGSEPYIYPHIIDSQYSKDIPVLVHQGIEFILQQSDSEATYPFSESLLTSLPQPQEEAIATAAKNIAAIKLSPDHHLLMKLLLDSVNGSISPANATNLASHTFEDLKVQKASLLLLLHVNHSVIPLDMLDKALVGFDLQQELISPIPTKNLTLMRLFAKRLSLLRNEDAVKALSKLHTFLCGLSGEKLKTACSTWKILYPGILECIRAHREKSATRDSLVNLTGELCCRMDPSLSIAYEESFKNLARYLNDLGPDFELEWNELLNTALKVYQPYYDEKEIKYRGDIIKTAALPQLNGLYLVHNPRILDFIEKKRTEFPEKLRARYYDDRYPLDGFILRHFYTACLNTPQDSDERYKAVVMALESTFSSLDEPHHLPAPNMSKVSSNFIPEIPSILDWLEKRSVSSFNLRDIYLALYLIQHEHSEAPILKKELLQHLLQTLSYTALTPTERLGRHLHLLPLLDRYSESGTYITELITQLMAAENDTVMKVLQQGDFNRLWEIPNLDKSLTPKQLSNFIARLKSLPEKERVEVYSLKGMTSFWKALRIVTKEERLQILLHWANHFEELSNNRAQKSFLAVALPEFISQHRMEEIQIIRPYLDKSFGREPQLYALLQDPLFDVWVMKKMTATLADLKFMSVPALWNKTDPPKPFAYRFENSSFERRAKLLEGAELDEDTKLTIRIYLDTLDGTLDKTTQELWAKHRFTDFSLFHTSFYMMSSMNPRQSNLKGDGEFFTQASLAQLIEGEDFKAGNVPVLFEMVLYNIFTRKNTEEIERLGAYLVESGLKNIASNKSYKLRQYLMKSYSEELSRQTAKDREFAEFLLKQSLILAYNCVGQYSQDWTRISNYVLIMDHLPPSMENLWTSIYQEALQKTLSAFDGKSSVGWFSVIEGNDVRTQLFPLTHPCNVMVYYAAPPNNPRLSAFLRQKADALGVPWLSMKPNYKFIYDLHPELEPQPELQSQPEVAP
jgi:tetratricopeptide (TPR) repeat protein